MKQRFRSGEWCGVCNAEHRGLGPCKKCGATHLGGDLYIFAVLKEEWVPEPVVWWKPWTWMGGYWKVVGLHSKT